jgi:hypothetical protein
MEGHRCITTPHGQPVPFEKPISRFWQRFPPMRHDGCEQEHSRTATLLNDFVSRGHGKLNYSVSKADIKQV